MTDFFLQSCAETVLYGIADSMFFRNPVEFVESARELLFR